MFTQGTRQQVATLLDAETLRADDDRPAIITVASDAPPATSSSWEVTRTPTPSLQKRPGRLLHGVPALCIIGEAKRRIYHGGAPSRAPERMKPAFDQDCQSIR